MIECEVYQTQEKYRFSLYQRSIRGWSFKEYDSFSEAWNECQKLFALLFQGCPIDEIEIDFIFF